MTNSTEQEPKPRILDIVPPQVSSGKPVTSIILEGYNEIREYGTAEDNVEALRRQTFPMKTAELILMGGSAQAEKWKEQFTGETTFHSVRAVVVDGLHYFQLKNRGATVARADILAMTDSDCIPHTTWLAAAVETIQGGADCCFGPSLFFEPGGRKSSNIFLRIAASMNWGWVLGPKRSYGYETRGFMDHNVAFRASVFREQMMYREDLGRILAPLLLFYRFQRNGNPVRVSRLQRAEHRFTWWYFLVGLLFRYGHEVYRLRREDTSYPHRWMMRTGVLEPLITWIWHVLLDIPRWFRHSGLLDMHPFKQWLSLPLVVLVCFLCRSFEAAGLFATLIRPDAVRRWAENV